jgi:hypothetical protein
MNRVWRWVGARKSDDLPPIKKGWKPWVIVATVGVQLVNWALVWPLLKRAGAGDAFRLGEGATLFLLTFALTSIVNRYGREEKVDLPE